MVFSSLLFIFQFLPATLILYFIAPKRLKNTALFLVSMVFYSWGEIRYLPPMIGLILVNYFCAIIIGKAKNKPGLKAFFLAISVVVSIGLLVVFKYYDFFTKNLNSLLNVNIKALNLSLPLGISFYTFQNVAYVIDVYRGKSDAQKNIINLGAFIIMFPQLIAGPIVRYTEVSGALASRSVLVEDLEEGMEDFILGLARKVLIANNVGMLWTEVEKIGFGTISTPLAWLGILAFSLQIYFDFSGYSQMAIGLGKMLGFKFPQNFNNPYISRSVTDFWRRWHMTLGTWFRDYVYFPLGGSRHGNMRTTLNLFIVWSLTGLWHGASWNFLLWGLYFFFLLIIEKSGFISFLNERKFFSHIYMMIVLLFGWALFAITDFASLSVFIRRMVIPASLLPGGYTVGAVYYLRNYAAILLVGCFFSTSLGGVLYKKIRRVKSLKLVIMAVLFLVAVAYLVDSTFNPFLYFRF